jgi:hypothetical protein
MQRNLMDRLLSVFSFAGTLTVTTNGAVVDGKDLLSVAYLVSPAAFTFSGTNKITMRIFHSDDGSTFTEALEANGDLYGANPVLDTPAEGAASSYIEYRGTKRYTRLQLEVGGTVSVAVGALAIGKPKLMAPNTVISLA